MSIIVPEPPERGLEILRTALGSQTGADAWARRSLEFETALRREPGVEARDVSAAAPHRVYFVRLDAVARGEVISAAELTGWRYILTGGDKPLLSAVLNTAEDGDALEFSHISSGTYVASTVECVRRAEKLEQVRAGDYELRLLNIPALYVAAVWLHGEGDIIMPLSPAPTQLSPYYPYTERELAGALRVEAERILAMNEDFTGRLDEADSMRADPEEAL